MVPWGEAYQLDEARFRQELRTLFRRVTRHVYLFGTAGEGYAVTDAQYDHILRVFREEEQAEGGRGMIGVISLSLATIQERIERARSLGFRQFQVSLPSWGALTDAEVDRFFADTCGRFSDCRFLHYNLERARRILGGKDYARLAAVHPNLVAAKVAGVDEGGLRDLLETAPALQFFLTDRGYARMRDRHECGLLISLGLLWIDRASELFAARGAALAAWHGKLQTAYEQLVALLGPGCHMDGAFDKLIYRLHDPGFPLRLLPPYAYPTDDTAAAFRALILDGSASRLAAGECGGLPSGNLGTAHL